MFKCTVIPLGDREGACWVWRAVYDTKAHSSILWFISQVYELRCWLDSLLTNRVTAGSYETALSCLHCLFINTMINWPRVTPFSRVHVLSHSLFLSSRGQPWHNVTRGNTVRTRGVSLPRLMMLSLGCIFEVKHCTIFLDETMFNTLITSHGTF